MTSAPIPSPANGAKFSSQRLLSLDALRGFDLMWIVGADAFGTAFAHLDAGSWFKHFADQFEHVAWEGFHFEDLIFPLFVFMVGVSITYSLGRMVSEHGRSGALKRIFRRTLILYLLGLFYYGGLSTPIAGIRYAGVLQRIALCYCFASLLFIYFRPRTLVVTCVALLVGYWVLLTFVPVPGFGAGDYSEGHNLANWIDKNFLPGRQWNGDHDPEGILSTLPAVATCLLGVFAGLLLRDASRTDRQKAAILAGGGVAMIVLGLLWSLQFPVIKAIWTSSFVLLSGGWSALLLALFYLVADIWKWRAWTPPFVWLGANAITLYVLSAVMNFWSLSERFVGGDVQSWLNGLWGGLGGLVLAIVSTVICMAIGRFLYVRRIFIKV